MRRAFTLLEVLTATVLAAGIAITSASWLLAVQRSANAVRQQSDDMRAALLVATRLRTDLIYTSADKPPDPQRMEMWIGTPAGGERQVVAWSLNEGNAIRSHQSLAGGPWTRELIANGISTLQARRDERGQLRIHISAGTVIIVKGGRK